MILEEHSDHRVVVKAPAKLNLYLDVLHRRDDGFHELESVMQTISLFDTITVEKSDRPGIQLLVRGRECPAGPENLVARAARSLVSAMNIETGLSVNLQKNTPLGAGLGGGSADAAATLGAIARLFGARAPDRDALALIAADLGSDVPFFLTGGTAIARGRGEKITPLVPAGMQRFDYVVLYPGVQASTPRVYGALDLNLTSPRHKLRLFADSLVPSTHEPTGIAEDTTTDSVLDYYNALERPFRSVYPEVADLQDHVRASTGRMFHVTGSGSAMFSAVRDVADGEQLIERLNAADLVHGGAVESFLCHGPVGQDVLLDAP